MKFFKRRRAAAATADRDTLWPIQRVPSLPSGVAETIDPNAEVKVKDYERQPIISQNERQISRLAGSDIEVVTSVLKEQDDGLLEFFQYEMLD